MAFEYIRHPPQRTEELDSPAITLRDPAHHPTFLWYIFLTETLVLAQHLCFLPHYQRLLTWHAHAKYV